MFTWPLRRTHTLGCSLELERQAQNTLDPGTLSATLELEVPDAARILIVCDEDALTGQLKQALQKEGLLSGSVKSMTEGCASVRSGRFQVVFTTPALVDGSWKRLADLANYTDLPFVIVLVATNFDLTEWVGALEDGAFYVLDALDELPKAGETARRALWAAYLKGATPLHPEDALPPWAA